MKYIHKCNDLTFDLDLTSEVLGGAMDPTVIRNVKCFTRKNGRLYSCSFSDNTLIANGNRVTVVLNNHGLEAGILQYVVELQIPDTTYPDGFKKIHQFYVSDIELVTGNGEQMEVDVEALYGTTIDEKINAMDAQIDSFQDDIDSINASLGSVKAKNTIQDASINHIEEVLSTIDGGTSDAIDRLDTSVNALNRDVSTLNASVNNLYNQEEQTALNVVNLSTGLNDVSTRVDTVEGALANKADVSVLGNYYTMDQTYNKDEVDQAIAQAALDGSLPAGVVIDNNYVHTDNNYTTEDKNKVRDFDLSLYPTNASIVENYATKAEVQSVDDNHPTNASVSATYVKKNDMNNYLSDYPTNASIVENYPTKNDVSTVVYEDDLGGILSGYATNASVSDNYVHWLYANENYVSYENIDEIIFNTIDNNYDVQWKIDEVVQDSSYITDISTNVSDVSVKVIDVSLKAQDISTRLNRDYLTTTDIQRDYITNASVSANYTTKDEFNEVWTTGFLTQDSADELYASKNDVSVFITDNDASVYLTDNDVSIFVTNSSVSANYASKNDISTFKSIVFITESDYDTLVQNDDVDENTVYMINGQPVTYLTANDVSNFVTDNDISTFITENDVSNFVTDNDISTFITDNDASVYLTSADLSDYWQKEGDDNNSLKLNGDTIELKTQQIRLLTANNTCGLKTFYNTAGSLYDGTIKNGENIVFQGNQKDTQTYTYQPAHIWQYSQKLAFFSTSSEYDWNKRMSVIGGLGCLMHNDSNDQSNHLFYFNLRRPDSIKDNNSYLDVYEILNSGNWRNYIDVSSFITDNDISTFITDNDASIYLTDNDVSIYATTSYVDTQLGNIQNILQTI